MPILRISNAATLLESGLDVNDRIIAFQNGAPKAVLLSTMDERFAHSIDIYNAQADLPSADGVADDTLAFVLTGSGQGLWRKSSVQTLVTPSRTLQTTRDTTFGVSAGLGTAGSVTYGGYRRPGLEAAIGSVGPTAPTNLNGLYTSYNNRTGAWRMTVSFNNPSNRNISARFTVLRGTRGQFNVSFTDPAGGFSDSPNITSHFQGGSCRLQQLSGPDFMRLQHTVPAVYRTDNSWNKIALTAEADSPTILTWQA